MNCDRFIRALEEHFDAHGGEPEPAPNRELARHLEGCVACAGRWRTAIASRHLLFALRRPEASPDPAFWTRLKPKLESRNEGGVLFRLPVRWRDVLVAGTVFIIALTSFIVDVRHTETPDISEAVALDVPHVHWQHPSTDHSAGATDVFLSLLNP